MNIANVISWKFNNQNGMETTGDVITKFPGGIPSQADQDTWTAEYEPIFAAQQEIRQIETMPRRIREALIALGTTDQVIINEDDAIKVERAKL